MLSEDGEKWYLWTALPLSEVSLDSEPIGLAAAIYCFDAGVQGFGHARNNYKNEYIYSI